MAHRPIPCRMAGVPMKAKDAERLGVVPGYDLAAWRNTMRIQVVGISGSPMPNSNTDRAVQRILEFTGLSNQFVKLSDLDLAPCRACLGCVKTNQCVVQDDGQALADLFHGASAFVLGGYTPYSSLDARTKAFMERMYCHRHRIGGNARKFGVAVITTACPPGFRGCHLPPRRRPPRSASG